jgi:hypothetical protein
VTGRSRFDDLLSLVRQRPHLIFRLLTALIVVAIAGTLALGIVDRRADPVLSIEFPLFQPRLSHLPIHIDRIRSCSCWHGPRDQAQRKYKFRIVNNTSRVINIDGGPHSVIRLIVAYPTYRQPRITMPAHSSDETREPLGSPPDIEIPITRKITTVKPSKIPGSNKFFGVPKGYSVWALPATPNKLAETIGSRGDYSYVGEKSYLVQEVSYPTVVDKTHLLPGEEYEGHRRGHGTWTFYISLPHHVAQKLEGNGETEPFFSREFYERFVIFVGVAALVPGPNGQGRLLGFGPAPSENAFVEPGDL